MAGCVASLSRSQTDLGESLSLPNLCPVSESGSHIECFVVCLQIHYTSGKGPYGPYKYTEYSVVQIYTCVCHVLYLYIRSITCMCNLVWYVVPIAL